MDFFDPQKQKEHSIRLAVGYGLIAVILILATTIMLYWARGFGLDKNGRIIQNGLVFVSSTPEDGVVYVNGKKYKDLTNTRLNIPDGQYTLDVKKDGYRTWSRAVSVRGGDLERLNYALLFPTKLQATAVKQYAAAPALFTQSPDRRWLLSGSGQDAFDLFDLKDSTPVPRLVQVPTDILAAGSTTTSWAVVEWADDNRHVLLRRAYDALGLPGSEYILFDRGNPAESQNLSVLLGFTPTAIELRDGAFDTYYAFDQASGQLFTASLKRPTPQPYIRDVLAFASQDDAVLFVTAAGAPAGTVQAKLQRGGDTPYTLRQLAPGPYLLDLGLYKNKLYAAISAQSENRAYIFKDPVAVLKAHPDDPLIPVQLLKITGPTHLKFSAQNDRFMAVQSGDRFAVYDAETKRAYYYQATLPLDAPQTHATWLDGFRLTYVSGGKQTIMDYDGINAQGLSPAQSIYLPSITPDNRFMYTLNAQNGLTRTPLRTPSDL